MHPRRLALIAIAGLGAQTISVAQDGSAVYSVRADSVAVTIYPNNLALITETRTVELPASPVTLVIQDVADTLLPQSAVIRELGRPLAESNFDFNRLTPETLLEHSIGQTVTLIRTNPATGVVSRIPATVVTAGDRVVLETEDGTEALDCAGLPEGITFPAVPDDLYANPQLSIQLAGGDPGRQTIRVSYLAHGFEWSADYVAQLDASGESMDLAGWATVTNSSGRNFDQAELQLVAGKLNVLRADAGGSLEAPDYGDANSTEGDDPDPLLLGDCYASDVPDFSRRNKEPGRLYDTVIVTGTRIRREDFADYHLYRLPWRTDLGARQTKQVRFLELADIRVERFYQIDTLGDEYPRTYPSLDLVDDWPDGPTTLLAPAMVVIRTENTADAGLGEPLPGGRVNVFENHAGGSILAGLGYLTDRPVGTPVEFEIAQATDAMAEITFRTSDYGDDGVRLEADYRAINDKSVPIELEVRHSIDTFEVIYEIDDASRPFAVQDGFYVWRLTVPPGIETLSYTLLATFLR